MKLVMQQKVFSFGDKFNITDEFNTPLYQVQGEVLSWGKKLHLNDLQGNELAFVSEKVFSFLPRYFVYVNGIEVAQVVKEFTFFSTKYRIEGLDWQVNGDFFQHDYEILGSSKIANVQKRWFSWGDCYEIDIAQDQNPVLVLAVVLAIDAAIEKQRNNNN